MNLTAKTVSNKPTIRHPNALQHVFHHYPHNIQWNIDNDTLKMYGNVTFEVFDRENGEELEPEFFAALAYCLEETVSITTVSFTGNRYEPEASRWIADKDTIELQHLGDTSFEVDTSTIFEEVPETVTQHIPTIPGE